MGFCTSRGFLTRTTKVTELGADVTCTVYKDSNWETRVLNIRRERRISRRVKISWFQQLKTLDEFDWSFNAVRVDETTRGGISYFAA
jgi:hypothetical protein